jgi:hypothetical protein
MNIKFVIEAVLPPKMKKFGHDHEEETAFAVTPHPKIGLTSS